MNALQRINSLENYMQGLPQVACDCIHAFAPGIYIRQVKLKAGSLVLGHHHKHAHLNIMLSGHMTMINDDGTRAELRAPVVCVANPGRKLAYIHEDSVWLNLYATPETNVEKLEEELLDKSQTWKELNEAFQFNRDNDRIDFDAFLFENGLSAEWVRKESENEFDQIALPMGVYKFILGTSAIEGKGLICTADIAPGEVIAPARIEGRRTLAGRYANHSPRPNAAMMENYGDIFLVATKAIGGALGGQPGDEITVNYRDALKLNKALAQ